MVADITGPVGPVDRPALRQIRDLLTTEEPLVDDVRFDDPVDPTELLVELSVGRDSPGRFEITWWTRGAYRYHYTEPDGIDFRFDAHPKDGASDAHFHPPPDGDGAVPSVLSDAIQPQVVTRAILAQWRHAVVDDHGLDTLNASH